MNEACIAIGVRAGDLVPCGACKRLTPFRGGHYAPSSELCAECSYPRHEDELYREFADWE